MAAAIYDLTIDQGADWFWTIRWKVGSTQRSATPKSTTGFQCRMQIRETYSSPTAVLSLNTQNGRVTVSSSGLFQLHATAVQTAAIPAGKYVYDVEAIAPNGVVTKLSRGTVRIVPEVTR
jgi:hypothetical protein